MLSVRLHNELRLRPIAPLVHHDILDVVRAGRDRFPEPPFFDGRLGMVVPHVFEGYLHQRLFVIGPQAMATVAQGSAQNRAHLGPSFPFSPTRKPHPSYSAHLYGSVFLSFYLALADFLCSGPMRPNALRNTRLLGVRGKKALAAKDPSLALVLNIAELRRTPETRSSQNPPSTHFGE